MSTSTQIKAPFLILQVEFDPSSLRITVTARIQEEHGDVPALLFVSVAQSVEALLDGLGALPHVRLPCPVCVASQADHPTHFSKSSIEVGCNFFKATRLRC